MHIVNMCVGHLLFVKLDSLCNVTQIACGRCVSQGSMIVLVLISLT